MCLVCFTDNQDHTTLLLLSTLAEGHAEVREVWRGPTLVASDHELKTKAYMVKERMYYYV